MSCLISKKMQEKANNNSSESIEDSVFDNNLLFYTILKSIVQCRLTDQRMITLQVTIDKLFQNNKTVNDFKDYFLTSETIVNNTNANRNAYENLISLLVDNNLDAWVYMVDTAIDLLLFKDLILQEAKSFTTRRSQNAERKIEDHLSIEYDAANLCSPYGQKVLSSLLVQALTNINRRKEYLLSASNQTVKQVYEKINRLTENYSINCNNMLMLIVDESISQSIKSAAGSSYEDRVEYMVKPLVQNWKGHSHDNNIKAMEYDFTFTIHGKLAGVSAKRTLRERYKQNHEDVKSLDVDYVFLFTLGTDLNEDKLNSILQKNGTYVVVAHEVYNSKPYLKNNTRVISSSSFTNGENSLVGIIK